jgi:hypothetical protein
LRAALEQSAWIMKRIIRIISADSNSVSTFSRMLDLIGQIVK